jgi:RNA polymerase sigma factor for flagellar operon FliA
MRVPDLPPRSPKVTQAEKRDRIVLEHLPLVKSIAIRVHENLPVHVDLDDLVHAGVLGLFDAVEKFDVEKNVAFHSYAKHRIKGAILDSLRQQDWASRDLRRRQKQVDAVARELSMKLGRTPTEAEVGAEMGIGEERWHKIIRELRTVGPVAPSALEDDRDRPQEYAATPELEPDRMCARRQLRATLEQAVKTLPHRYQKVVFLYYSDELTMKEIGEVMGVNESRVSQIHKSALQKMAGALQAAGIHSSGAF